MRNLFVCHTQAHLILASGLTKGRFKDDENDLVLFVDFKLNEDMKIRLKRTFNRCLFLQSIYPAEYNTYFAKMKWYPEDWKQINRFMVTEYQKVFVVCDNIILVQRIMKLAKQLNPKTMFCAIEDGIISYYKNIDIRGGLDKNSVTRFLRKIIFKKLCGIGDIYDRDYPDFSGSKHIKYLYTLYPEAVREPFKSLRSLVKIDDCEYLLGLSALYATSKLPIKEGDIILLLDKLDTYMNVDITKKMISNFIHNNLSLVRNIFCKFHPRETEHWEIFSGCNILDNTVGVESMYLSLADKAKEITVVGIKSSGIMSAKKLGFKTVSLFCSCGEDNEELIKFFKRIGIELK